MAWGVRRWVENRIVRHELDSAGVGTPALRAAYHRCRQLNAQHGRTYFLATQLLTPARRPAIHALYGFARWVDDIVDDPNSTRTPGGRRAELAAVEAAVHSELAGNRGNCPVVSAAVDTAFRYGLEPGLFTDFLAAMRQDLSVSHYATRAELRTYVHGSAEVIGLQVLPVLGTSTDYETAAARAAALGTAFQLTNFLRDVGEDLARGRVYLPADELAAFGVDHDRLLWCLRAGRTDERVRRALADQVSRTRTIYRYAEPGITMLDPVSRPCVATAFTLYQQILDRIVESNYEVFGHRATVPNTRRAGVALSTAGVAIASRTRNRLIKQAPEHAGSPRLVRSRGEC